MSNTSDFVHLHLHSQYSLLDGAIRLPDLIEQVKEYGMPAVAVTDHGNMFGTVDFFHRAKAAGIKPILGCEAYVSPKARGDRTRRGNYHLILLAKNKQGYQNLKYLVTMAYTEGFYYKPRIDKELLSKHSQGLIGASACLGGEVAHAFRNGGIERAKETAKIYRDIFEPGCYFLEVQNNGYAGQAEYNAALRQIGTQLDIPLVATNDAHYLTSDDAKAHNVLMFIQKGVTLDDPKAESHYSDELFLRTADEMREVMADFPDAVENTLKIANMCEEVDPTNEISLPDYKLPEGVSLNEFLHKTSHEMLDKRFEEFEEIDKHVDREAYRKRLDIELGVICDMGFPGYFLIVQDFINYAKDVGIPVGPGRGSGAGSLVAYALRITNLDPLPLNLLFERFLNPERVSMPDFDIDFCKDRREEVIAYVVEKYGKNNVGQIATFHQLKSRSVVRDVGRVMSMAYGDVDKIAKLIPEGPKVSLASALRDEPRLIEARQADRKTDELLGYAERLENLNRHAGMHAAGVVIGNEPLWEYVPCFKAGDRDQVTNLVSQFDMKFVEQCGLVKFDFLGLKTLTVIDTAIKLINKRLDRTEPIDIDALSLDDPKVYELIASGNTWGVFQLESSGFQELLKRLQPDCFEDIVAAVALYRPGPLEGGMVDQFVECKHGRQEIVYPHEKLEGILKETYGVIVYQEQVMQSAQILAGYSLGGADIMRRAMGKKKIEEMAKQRLLFVAGCKERGIDEKKSGSIFDLIDKFAGYGFNKSHSAAYALITYQTAWLKTHYPVEFQAGILTCDCEDTDKVARYIRSGKSAGVEVLKPDVNQSQTAFSVIYPKDKMPQILFGLGAIKGVGAAALGAIIETREKDGQYKDVYDFTSRVDLSKVNKAVIESLIKAGAFDSTVEGMDVNRGKIFSVLDKAIERGRGAQRDRESGQTNMFGAFIQASKSNDNSDDANDLDYSNTLPWDDRTLLANEKASIGFYMSGHPMDQYVAEAAKTANCTTSTIGKFRPNEKVTIAGMVMDYAERVTKTGKRMALFAIEDLAGRVDVVVYSDALTEFHEILKTDDPLFITGTIRLDQRGEEEKRNIILKGAKSLDQVRSTRTRQVHIVLDGNVFDPEAITELKAALEKHPGRCDAFLNIVVPGQFRTSVRLAERYRTAPTDELKNTMANLAGITAVEFS